MRTLGRLDAFDIGATVTIRDGGSTHSGELRSIEHSGPTFAGQRARTLVHLRRADWSHIKTYDSTTECTVEPATQEQP